MGLEHAAPGEVVSLEHDAIEFKTHALVKSVAFEAIRVVLPAGKVLPNHSVEGEMTVQCLRGKVRFPIGNKERVLSAGDWLYLKGGEEHGAEGLENSVLLVTIIFPR